jgi:hypothetical protein
VLERGGEPKVTGRGGVVGLDVMVELADVVDDRG